MVLRWKTSEQSKLVENDINTTLEGMQNAVAYRENLPYMGTFTQDSEHFATAASDRIYNSRLILDRDQSPI
jgi:hypothetical protein